MFDPSKSLKKMLGGNLQVPSLMTGVKGPNDWDGDGILNKFDCQPRNLARQDRVNFDNVLVPDYMNMESFKEGGNRESFLREMVAKKGYVYKTTRKQEKIGESGDYKIYNFVIDVEKRKVPFRRNLNATSGEQERQYEAKKISSKFALMGFGTKYTGRVYISHMKSYVPLNLVNSILNDRRKNALVMGARKLFNDKDLVLISMGKAPLPKDIKYYKRIRPGLHSNYIVAMSVDEFYNRANNYLMIEKIK